MLIPPSLKRLVPSLMLNEGETAALTLDDLRTILPSVAIEVAGTPVPGNAMLTISIDDLRKICRVALANVEVDEAWYMSHVDGLRGDVQNGKFESATEHYLVHGYIEGRLPGRPRVDERFYLSRNPDVAAAIKAGRVKSAFDHFVQDGYAEGRWATADDELAYEHARRK